MNNGNLQASSFSNSGATYANGFLPFTQTYTYDGVNRLMGAMDSGGWTRSFGYDAYGNMTPSGNPGPPTESFNTNNQIAGASYDSAGKLLMVNGNTVSYDFEDRLITETDGISKAVENYIFDGDGHRVEKYNSASRTVFVYDALGRLAAEYAQAQDAPTCINCYLSVDELGTARMVTDQDGSLVARHDYLPFGEEVAANTFGRDGHWGPTNDSISQKFTGKERDSESGLDYFGARYYGSALGRFTSPDWSTSPEAVPYAELTDLQTLNQYAYIRNNPLSKNDPTGHCPVCVMVLESLAVQDEVEEITSNPAFQSAVYAVGAAAAAGVGYATGLWQRGADALSNIVHSETTDRGRSNESKGLDAVGAVKNTKPMTITDPKTGEKVTTIPDGKKPMDKDAKSASLTKQIRAENTASQATSCKPVNVVVGENTNVS